MPALNAIRLGIAIVMHIHFCTTHETFISLIVESVITFITLIILVISIIAMIKEYVKLVWPYLIAVVPLSTSFFFFFNNYYYPDLVKFHLVFQSEKRK